MKDFNEKIRQRVSELLEGDEQLVNELINVRKNPQYLEQAARLSPELPSPVGGLEKVGSNFALETIVLRIGRPVLSIYHDDAILQFKDVESAFWISKLQEAEPKLKNAIRSVGRINLENDVTYEWVGTGWMLESDIMITNRHVAEVFGKANGAKFIFKQGSDGSPIKASIDFLEEENNPDSKSFAITEILYIEKDPGPDIAFLRVTKIAGDRSQQPISLASSTLSIKQEIVVIGYPASDSRIPDQLLMTKIFGDVYDKKRLSPGILKSVSENLLLHDCTTLGGNSGSVMIDLKTGQAVGIHFGGRYLENNSGVPAAVISQRLKRLRGGSRTTEQEPAADIPRLQEVKGNYTLNYLVPISISISAGDLLTQNPPKAIAANSSVVEPDEFFTEAKTTDYVGREGYMSEFLGSNFKVPLPVVIKQKKDVLKFGKEQILKYEHFSVVMNKNRRQCIYSAVNIDGRTSVPMARGPWRLDPRIPADTQIIHECYGLSPKFSRGHMTRREDPIWGKGGSPALGNTDSMHVTNTVPQMQSLNAGIWLGLENYAIKNARKDKMRICVFTGPVFKHEDPVMYGIKIPVSFWKVIAFVHDKTKKLSATGYWISQKEFLMEEEFVYGKHKTYQKKISDIEKITGLSFGKLSSIDPFGTVDELPDTFLTDPDQIKFI